MSFLEWFCIIYCIAGILTMVLTMLGYEACKDNGIALGMEENLVIFFAVLFAAFFLWWIFWIMSVASIVKMIKQRQDQDKDDEQ